MLVSLFKEGQDKVEVGAKRKSEVSVELEEICKKEESTFFY